MKRTRLLLLATALACALPAAAEEHKGFYVGGTLGQATARGACDGIAGPGVTCSDSDGAWRLLAGYQFTRNFSAEAGYHDFGKVSASSPLGSAEIKSSAFELVGVGAMPLGERFSLYGKLGLYVADSKGSNSLGFSASDSATDLTFGAGLQYALTPSLGLRGEFQRYSDVGGDNVGKGDIDVLSVGLLWRF